MAISFTDMKRSSESDFDKLSRELAKLSAPAQDNSKDPRLWSCATDKAGNGYAVIRFLPAPGAENTPFVRLWSHGWKGPGGWYIQNSRTTLGRDEKDPMAEFNTSLWNSGVDSDKKIVSGEGKDKPGSKRQLNYYSNIYVIKDSANPDNEGKVFLFRYGKKIFDKLNDLMHPTFADQEKVNPFDLWKGATFKLRIRRVDGYANYDQSSFDAPSPLADDDRMEAIWKQEHSLQDIIAPSNFKSYDELKKALERAQGSGSTPRQESNISERHDFNDDDRTPVAAPPAFRQAEASKPPFAMDDDDDEDFALFKRLADSSED